MKSVQVSRADLLRCLRQTGGAGQVLDSQAERLGYEPEPQAPAVEQAVPVLPKPHENDSKPVPTESTSHPKESPARSHLRFWIPAKLEVRSREEVDRLHEMPEAFRLPENFQPNYVWTDEPLPTPPLVPWSRLWPFLQRVLGIRRPGRAVDLDRLIRRLGKGEPIRRVPRQPRRSWHLKVHVLVDRRSRMAPFWDDYRDLIARLEQLRGTAGLSVKRLRWNPKATDPRRHWIEHRWGEEEGEGRPYGRPESGGIVLVLGDLGMLSGVSDRIAAWEQLGRELRRRGVQAWALVPCPRYRWLPEMAAVWRMAEWDRGRRLPRGLEGQRALPLPKAEREQRKQRRMEHLGVLVSPAVRVERALLRDIRLLAGRRLDAGAEYDLWNSEGTYGAIRAFSFKGPVSRLYRGGLKALPDLQLAGLVRRIRRHHFDSWAVFGPAELYALRSYLTAEQWDRLVAEGLTGGPDWEQAQSHYRELVGQLAEENLGGRDELAAWGARELARLPETTLKADAFQSLTCLTRKVLGETDAPLPDYVDPDKTAWIDSLLKGERPVYLGLEPQGIQVGETQPKYPVGTLKSRAGCVRYQARGVKGASPLREIVLPAGGPIEGSQPEDGESSGLSLTLSSDREQLHLVGLERPAWARRVGRDRFGVFADLEVNGVSLRMRWIPPGRFEMGERGARREVVLTLGFWLAETQTTQAFWEAAGGKREWLNEFTGAGRPVERVSWHECVGFGQRLEERWDGLHFGLPTDAQWEYACRAGTATRYHNGSDAEGSMRNLGRCRINRADFPRGTAEVRDFEPNAFGLFDMHGNVWEWCHDGRRSDKNDGDTDPIGSVTDSALRVIRGGGWGDPAQFCRSAYRGAFSPEDRSRFVGFRLAAGQKQPSGALGLWAEGAEAPGPWDRGSAISLSRGASGPPWATAIRHDEYGIIAEVTVNEVVFAFRRIPVGTFLMGSPEDEAGRYPREGPQHSVTISRPFWMGLTPVTQEQWQAIWKTKPNFFKGPKRPVERVSWKDVQSFCTELNRLVAGWNCGLPTEAQWEYACRAGNTGPFNDGSVCQDPEEQEKALDSLGWFRRNSGGKTQAVGEKRPNHWGLFDMHGNLHEWCADGFREFTEGNVSDPEGPMSAERVIRGGSWNYAAQYCRSASRSSVSPAYRYRSVGFRLAAGLELPASEERSPASSVLESW